MATRRITKVISTPKPRVRPTTAKPRVRPATKSKGK